jgi:aminoglycoside phosphotransferase (APT) family kinase protein
MIFPVERLIATQFPQWAHLPITPVDPGGWDNRTFRLGDMMTVRLPSTPGHAGQAEKEQHWLPVLAPQLPLPIPVPVASGVPGEGYPFVWSVYPWIDGETADATRIADMAAFAGVLADFLAALERIDPTGGPPPAPHGGFRGAPLLTYDAETRAAVATLGDGIDAPAVLALWDDALAATAVGPPVWFHGDVAAGNLLVRDERLAAVIDFGCSGVGDPACDLAIAWTLFSGASREAFRAALRVDDATWTRGRGWVLWKALITLAGPGDPGVAHRDLDAVLAPS